MEMIKNIITVIGCDLFTRGAQTFCGVIDSLTKKDRKKTSNYINAKSIGSAHCPQCFLRIII